MMNDINMKEYTDYGDSSSYTSKDLPKIRVIVRKRPLGKKELLKNEMDIIEMRSSNAVIVKELKTKLDLTKYVEEHYFAFDNTYDESSTNEMIYLESVRPLIEAAFNRTKVTCFAYGQTGSGKTFTMMGNNTSNMSAPGLYLLSAFDIFRLLDNENYNHLEVWVSFYEIYCGKLYDLLNDKVLLQAREDGKQNICIVGLAERQVTSLNSMMQVIEFGLKARTVGVTGANSDSSRSHGIIQVTLKEPNGSMHGKISFIDLAGSERAADTIDTNKQTRIDGAEINKSLLALKECIRALDQDKKHTPFRGSKLTLVLRDSFMGNCKTLMIANISPCSTCAEHTLNTLRYADRVKELKKEKSTEERDPNEVMANLLMMPRQHNKTVKYNVENANKRTSINSKAVKKPTISTITTNNINQFYQPIPNTSNNIIKEMSSSLATKENQPYTFNPFKENKENNNLESNIFGLLNKHRNQNKSRLQQSSALNLQANKENLEKLNRRHKEIIDNILAEEEKYLSNHETHIDEMLGILNSELNLVNQTKEYTSDINDYVGNLENIYKQEIEKVTVMLNRLNGFKQLLGEERNLSEQIVKLNEVVGSNQNESEMNIQEVTNNYLL